MNLTVIFTSFGAWKRVRHIQTVSVTNKRDILHRQGFRMECLSGLFAVVFQSNVSLLAMEIYRKMAHVI